MRFKDTKYGDLTNKIYKESIDFEGGVITSLEGSPKEVYHQFNCRDNNLTSLKYAPFLIRGEFHCYNNPKIKNQKQQIIENQIKAEYYYTDEGYFGFEEIKERFEKYKNILIKEKQEAEDKQKKLNYKKEVLSKIKNKKNTDYGLSF